MAGVTFAVRDGEIASCSTQLDGSPDAWALGSPAAWLSAVIEHDPTDLELGGDSRLVRSVLDALHEALFAVRSRAL